MRGHVDREFYFCYRVPETVTQNKIGHAVQGGQCFIHQSVWNLEKRDECFTPSTGKVWSQTRKHCARNEI